ncbi:tellurite resistance TerB C-terminal domain-containing protein [Mariniflexile ostreae]|uniref:Tellurite resistance TerB C-terminal domain-containing protein n=1 Tax=Mariniflexile ostreae TaxID=1520892 RepID=A0ABV5FCM7_9FLAO
MRNKTTASILAFFLGGLGIHQFYLRNYIRGAIFLLFSWTFIPILFGFVDFLILLVMNEDRFNDKYNKDRIRKSSNINRTSYIPSDSKFKSIPEKKIINPTIPSRTFEDERIDFYKSKDSSIVDVNETSFELNISLIDSNVGDYEEVPYWAHSYVYSFDALDQASLEQKEFYFYFKKKFLENEFIDVDGNTNYAFVLYFDIIKAYEDHNDIELLERQFLLLGEICPKTKNYSHSTFKNLLSKRTDTFSTEKLSEIEKPAYQFEQGYYQYDPDQYKLGRIYKSQLGLNENEVLLLNKFYSQSNVFTSIEGCLIAVVNQYLFVLKSFNKFINEENSSFEKEVEFFKKKIKQFYKDNSEYGYSNIDYINEIAETEIYQTIFRRIENFIRHELGHTRKLKTDFFYNLHNLDKEFDARIGEIVDKVNKSNKESIVQPDKKTQILLNAQNVNRWKIEFSKLKENFDKNNYSDFLESIIHLEEVNQKNPNIEHIFYEASKFIAKYDKVKALQFYAKYIHYDLKSKKFDYKQMNKTIQKSLFKNEVQIENFKDIIAKLIETRDIGSALEEILVIYVPKRKKIKLDRTEIQEVAKKHNSTVELLNEYLLNDEEDETLSEKINKESNEEEIEIVVAVESISESPFKQCLNFNKTQIGILQIMQANTLVISQSEVDEFALKNGMFKNQLIDSINEICFELLEGEPLIEEEEENYVIEKFYYQELEK